MAVLMSVGMPQLWSTHIHPAKDFRLSAAKPNGVLSGSAFQENVKASRNKFMAELLV